MPTPDLDTAPPEMTARWLRTVADDLRLRSMTALPSDDFDLYAIGESLDALAEDLEHPPARLSLRSRLVFAGTVFACGVVGGFAGQMLGCIGG